MTSPKPYELLIFDWDGTLVNSENQIVDAMQAAFVSCGIRPLGADRIRRIIGLGLIEAISQLLPEHEESDWQRVSKAYSMHFLGGDDSPEWFDGAKDILRDLHAAGYKLAVATGKGRRGLDKGLAACGIADLFTVTRCAGETESKPSPRMLQEILYETGLAASDALMIGDTEYDLLMARGIGMPTVAVTCGVHSASDLKKHSPLAVLESVQSLPEWLGLETPETSSI